MPRSFRTSSTVTTSIVLGGRERQRPSSMTKGRYYLRAVGWRGLICALKARALGTGVVMKLRVRGLEWPLYLRIPSVDIKVYEKVFLEEEYRFDVVSAPTTIVDAGAHIGMTSVYFANRYPDARIVAVEPEEQNFELLRRNVAPYRNVIPVQAALWDDNCEVNLFDPGGGTWGYVTEGLAHSPELPAQLRHRVPGVTIDRLMEDYGLPGIDLLKVDIEGAERAVFRGASSWLDRVDAIIIELHERLKPGCSRSFYCATNNFGEEWTRGENVFLSRGRCVRRSSS